MNRRTLLVVTIAGASLVLTACGQEATTDAASTPVASQESSASETESEAPVEEQPSEASTDDGINVDQGLLSTTVTLPADLFQGQSEEELNANAREEGWDTEITLNSDGSATFTLSRNEYNRLLDDMRQSNEENFQSLIDEDPKIYKSVTFSDDFGTVDVTVNRKAFENSINMFGFTAIFAGYYYQAFAGFDAKDIYTIVNYIDDSTGEVFETFDSREDEMFGQSE